MATTLLCRGIPLLSLPMTDGEKTGEDDVRISVHQLCVELWQRFDTPRPSVQRKVEDLKIRLYQCSKPQVKFLREKAIIHSYKATNISFQDAEKLCDALQHSRDKRGLTKHPLKPKCKGDRIRAEELWVLRLGAKKEGRSGGRRILKRTRKKKLEVEKTKSGCALNGNDEGERSQSSPTPCKELSPIVFPSQPPIRASVPAEEDSDSGSSSSLQFDTLLAADEVSALSREHEVAVVFKEESPSPLWPPSKHKSISQDLDALDLGVDLSKMLHACVPEDKTKPLKIPSHLPVSPIHRRNLHHNFSPRKQPAGNKFPNRAAPVARNLRPAPKRPLRSPELLSNEEEEEEVLGGREARRSRSSTGAARKGDRFLFLSSDEEDVVFVKVEKQKDKPSTDHPPQSQPCRRRVATKLRHFAHTSSPYATSSPNTTATVVASPGKHLPFGSTHSSESQLKDSLWVSISRSVLATPTSDKSQDSPVISDGCGLSQEATPTSVGRGKSHQTMPTSTGRGKSQQATPASTGRGKSQQATPTSIGRGKSQQTTPTFDGHGMSQQLSPSLPTNAKRNVSQGTADRPKAALSSFATLKRARSPPALLAATPSPVPSKKIKLNRTGVNGFKNSSSANKILSLLKSSRSKEIHITKNHKAITLDTGPASCSTAARTIPPLNNTPSSAKHFKMAAKSNLPSPAQHSPCLPPKAKSDTPMPITPSALKPPGVNSSVPKLLSVPPLIPKLVKTPRGPPPPALTQTPANRPPLLTSDVCRGVMEDDRLSVASSSSLSVHENFTGGRRSLRGQQRSVMNGNAFKFNDLFGYYPPKLVIQNGDLCPMYSLSVSGMDRSMLNSLPPSHPFWSWTPGQPTNRNAAAHGAKTNRRKNKSRN